MSKVGFWPHEKGLNQAQICTAQTKFIVNSEAQESPLVWEYFGSFDLLGVRLCQEFQYGTLL